MKNSVIKQSSQMLIKNLSDALRDEGKILCSFEISVQPSTMNTVQYQYFDTVKKEIFIARIVLDDVLY